MCLAIPMQIVERGAFEGTVELGGIQRRISLMLCEDARIGDFVLVHAGYAIGTIDAEEAKRTLEVIESVRVEEVVHASR